MGQSANQELAGYGSANCIFTAGSVLAFCGSSKNYKLKIKYLKTCSHGAKNGGLFAELCICGPGEGIGPARVL